MCKGREGWESLVFSACWVVPCDGSIASPGVSLTAGRLIVSSSSGCVRLILSFSLHRMFLQSLPSWLFQQKPGHHPEPQSVPHPTSARPGDFSRLYLLNLLATILVQVSSHHHVSRPQLRLLCCSSTQPASMPSHPLSIQDQPQLS